MLHFACMPHRWRLKEFLDQHGITRYALAKKLAGQLTQNTVYNLADDPDYIKINTFDVLIPALRALTGEEVTVADLLVWEPLGEDHG